MTKIVFNKNVRRWGNSLGITIPEEIQNALDIKEKTPVDMWIEDDEIRIKKKE